MECVAVSPAGLEKFNLYAVLILVLMNALRQKAWLITTSQYTVLILVLMACVAA